jgi:hypothetical protein
MLDRPGPYNRPRVHDDPAVRLTSYPGTVRQVIVTGLGRDAPTVIITNDDQITTRALISQYARRMTTGQRLAEIIQAFCADALSSTVNLNVDLDVVLCVLAQALLAAFRNRLGPGYAAATPDTLQRRFLDTAGTITTDGDTITVTLSRRTYSPVLRASPTCAPTLPSPGGKTAACTSSSASPEGQIRCMEIRAKHCGSRRSDATLCCWDWCLVESRLPSAFRQALPPVVMLRRSVRQGRSGLTR